MPEASQVRHQHPFDRAVEILLRPDIEGGYSNHSKDPGKETNHGISKAQYPNLDIKNLTRDDAIKIYHRDYWLKYHCHELEWPLALVLFDCFVQFSPKRPIQWLQEAVGVSQDGILGPKTIAAAKSKNPVNAALRIMIDRSNYRATRPTYGDFGNGWRKRDLIILTEAVKGWVDEE